MSLLPLELGRGLHGVTPAQPQRYLKSQPLTPSPGLLLTGNIY